MKFNDNQRYILAGLLILVSVLVRVMPHMPNVAPVAAASLIAGIFLGGRLAVVVPILAMLISDIFVGFYEAPVMVAVYLSFVAISMLGIFLSKYRSFATAVGGALFGSVLFFIITNFAVWKFSPLYLSYQNNFEGLMASYVNAIPFFRASIFGDLVYTSIFYATFSLALFVVSKREKIFASLNAVR